MPLPQKLQDIPFLVEERLLEPRIKVERYAGRSLNYLRNAAKFIDRGDAEKASEFLWGSIVQALKAVALSKGFLLKNHAAIWNYVDALTKDLQNKDIRDAFVSANLLHTNFYESELELDRVRILADDIRIAVGNLLALIQQKS